MLWWWWWWWNRNRSSNRWRCDCNRHVEFKVKINLIDIGRCSDCSTSTRHSIRCQRRRANVQQRICYRYILLLVLLLLLLIHRLLLWCARARSSCCSRKRLLKRHQPSTKGVVSVVVRVGIQSGTLAYVTEHKRGRAVEIRATKQRMICLADE